MAKMKRVFYAYPSNPPSIGETIENSLNKLRTNSTIKTNNVRFYPWTDLSTGGKRLVSNILKDIDRADVFASDLTFPNSNVAFELGYAIAQFKRIWLSLDTSIDGSQMGYRRLYYGLIGAGYVPYQNSDELAASYVGDPPDMSLDDTLLGPYFRNARPANEVPTMLYIKPPMNTDAVSTCMDLLEKSAFGEALIIDDPVENQAPTLEWYANHITSADAVLVHMLGNTQTGNAEHNLKCSFVAGLARGFGKPTFMTCMQPFESPIDYQELLHLHETASGARKAVKEWIDRLEKAIPRRRRRRPEIGTALQGPDLRALRIGEHVAENERNSLDDYFVETTTYYRALADQLTIVVGRKGAGKSAQLYAMEAFLLRDGRNHVCVIKPAGYEMDGLVRVLQSIVHNSEQGYLIESLWKFLLFSELAKSVYESIRSGPMAQGYGEVEQRFVRYYESRLGVLDPPFSERLDVAVRALAGLGSMDDSLEQRQRISEMLHTSELRQLREELGKVLTRHAKVSILIDNLDAQWGDSQDIGLLAKLLLGLLQVSSDIVLEFQKRDYWREPVSVFITVFLRSDIFSVIQPRAPEQDKLPIQRITWGDSQFLKRVIDFRLEHGNARGMGADETWQKLFPQEVVGKEPWEFVVDSVLPRPRDVVYLMRQAIDGAINRGHGAVLAEDLLDARDRYSEYVYRSVLAEDDPQRGKLEAVLIEFAGSPKIIQLHEIHKRLAVAGVSTDDFDFYIDLLCDINFLAIGLANGTFEYAKDEADRETKRRVAGRIAAQASEDESYEVSSAFWHVLQIE